MINPRPPAAALTWAAAIAGPHASARTVRRLAGGTHAATHLLETADPAGEMVLRRYPPGDRAAAREARVLTSTGWTAGHRGSWTPTPTRNASANRRP
ncbi:hypothetical protein SRB5_01160 [Streptomyces sp. RB5]|uniref:Aminoglycoside phosphotransferase domain-containing protein n=1 Tax=Streptomyces smaragdinus TaxID=2585196 RepID=A0A7K0CA49_9ACTN|nr:hypothetical protein [Streptomyces smaragdinus]MQY10012.1 hypothetical protein [Streptomyces smaragdinus]